MLHSWIHWWCCAAAWGHISTWNKLSWVPIWVHLRLRLSFSVAWTIRMAKIILRGGKYHYHSVLSTCSLDIQTLLPSSSLLGEPSCSRHTSTAIHSFVTKMRNVPHVPQACSQKGVHSTISPGHGQLQERPPAWVASAQLVRKLMKRKYGIIPETDAWTWVGGENNKCVKSYCWMYSCDRWGERSKNI